MTIEDDVRKHVQREAAYQRSLARLRKPIPKRVPPQPARDDRGARKPWRPGDR